MASLVITSGPMEGRRVDISDGLVIGRTGADLLLDDELVSRRHVAVRSVKGGLEIKDLGSINGTKVDGRTIDGPTLVRHGAVLTIGTTTIAVHLPQGSDAGETRVMPSPDPSSVQVPRSAGFAPNAVGAAAVEAPRSFGSYQAAPSRRRRTAATRLWIPQVLTYASVLATAAALIAYFAAR